MRPRRFRYDPMRSNQQQPNLMWARARFFSLSGIPLLYAAFRRYHVAVTTAMLTQNKAEPVKQFLGVIQHTKHADRTPTLDTRGGWGRVGAGKKRSAKKGELDALAQTRGACSSGTGTRRFAAQ